MITSGGIPSIILQKNQPIRQRDRFRHQYRTIRYGDILKGHLHRPDDPKYPTDNVSKDPSVAQRAFSPISAVLVPLQREVYR